jgi:MFS transporter, CP family, cyanate transporter
LLAVGIVLTGLNLRIAVASVPPIIDELQRELGLSATAAGVLTAAPVLCFGALAPLAPALARRVGGERLLLLTLLPILVGVLARGAGSTFALFAGTVLAGAGIAVANVVVPSVVKGRFARGAGLVTGLYVAALTGGAALAAGLTVPFEQEFGWQVALAGWTFPAAVAAVVLGTAVARDRDFSAARGERGEVHGLLRDALAWQVTLYMGLQSLVFYAALAWLPSILRDSGYGAGAAGTLLALYALGGIPASLLVPVLATRLRDQRLLGAAVTLFEALALLGLLLAPGVAVAWVALFAVGQGGAIALALTLMVLRSPDPKRAAELSGMAQAVGYSIAALGPLAVGTLHDWSGDWDLPLAALLLVTVPLLGAGIAAGRDRMVRPAGLGDSELPARATELSESRVTRGHPKSLKRTE